MSRVGPRAPVVFGQQGQGSCNSNFNRCSPAAPIEGQVARPVDAEISWRERIVTVAATTVGVLIVATIALLMGVIN
jgi:hypothetical protein